MNLIACGINHKTAPIALREQLAVEPEKQKAFLSALLQELNFQEAIFLNTCNRCEVYTVTDSYEALIHWLCDSHRIAANDFLPHVYIHQGVDAISHAMKVASGMDSMVFGEPQIFGQLKNAVAQAKEVGALGAQLNTVFQQVFTTAKKIRTHTQVGNETLSIASIAVNLSKLIYEDFCKLNVLLIGAGDTMQQVAKYLHSAGVKNIYAINRSIEKAIELVKPYDGMAYTLDNLLPLLESADIVISATSSQSYIIKKEEIVSIIKKKLSRPKYFIDLAVPRDIEPEVGALENVYLYNIDDLQKICDNNLQKRKTAQDEAENIIKTDLTHCMHKLKARQHHHIIQNYREKADKIRQSELDKAMKLIQSGHDVEDVMHKLALGITNKLTHEPTLYLKDVINSFNK